jgi:acetolactate synthase I/II/III large subunit
LEVQSLAAAAGTHAVSAIAPASPVIPSDQDVDRLVAAVAAARRPVFVAGRGARAPEAASAVAALADACGALLATSAVAKGLFHGDPWDLDVSGGFSSPTTASLIQGADLVVGWGCALNMWTMRHGRLIGEGTTVVQIDDTAEALGSQRELTFGVLGDVTATARAVRAGLEAAPRGPAPAADDGTRPRQLRYRSDEVRAHIASTGRWRDEPYRDAGGNGLIDPRTFTLALDEVLPTDRVVAVDSGNFMGYPSMFLSVPDEQGFCFTQAFQSIGLGLATAIGAALARPDRLPIAALGDGGCLMAATELDTVVRLGLPMVVCVYNDDAYGAEVHHFGPDGHVLDTVRFPATDIAAIARGHGFTAVTIREVTDLSGVRAWLDGERNSPLLIDAKVTRDEPAWWLEEAFRGH